MPRRFGIYPANTVLQGGIPRGIPTADESYKDGYSTGLGWKEDYTPGGPWVCTYHPYHLRADLDWKLFCEATAENNREYLRGFADARQGKPKRPPHLDIDHAAVLGFN